MSLLALVVDDSMLIRHTICRFLEARGFAVESAGDGREALAILEKSRADVIITDRQMPNMCGSEFIAALKAQPQTANIPIVIVAGKRSELDKNEKQADFAIYKDIDIVEQLAKALKVVLETPRRKSHSAGK